MVGAFSSGMKQRLLIARALVARPTILLLDEPTRSLDPVSARSFRQFLRDEISGRQKCTVLLATHNAEEALELCHRVAVLDRGRLMALGTADELARRFLPTRFRVWTRDATHAAFTSLREREAIQHVRPVGEAAAWQCLEMEIPGGYDRTASVIEALARRGVRIARFEQVTVSLADLIHAIVEQGRAGDPNA
jgi:ABC-type multidrug transport system ATPase subunit